MTSRKAHLMLFLLGGLFLLLDQYLKWMSLHEWTVVHLWNNMIGWAPFLNPGVAFGIPIPNFVVLVITIPIVFLIIYYLDHQLLMPTSDPKRHMIIVTALTAILVGALSNLIDRVLYRHTVDYIQVFTAVINLADVMIVGGFVTYLLSLRHKH